MEKCFVLGLGAQKSGTSWLRHYLNSHDFADFDLAKEYHVWDVLCESEKFAHYDVRGVSNIRLKRLIKQSLGMALGPLDVRQKMQEHPNYYFEHFGEILRRPEISVTGDICPSYVFLPLHILNRIRDGFVSMGIAVKVVLLMRDPVERCWSCVRMHKRKGASMEGVDVDLPIEEALRRYYRTSDCIRRTRYQDTISVMREVFRQEEIYIDTYENILLNGDLNRLAIFFGVPLNNEFLSIKYEETKKKETISESLYSEIAEFYADVYQVGETIAPDCRLLWPGFKYI